MLRTAVHLEEWRSAERRRDALPTGSPAWQVADDDVRRAQKLYGAEVSQAAAHYAELAFVPRDSSLSRWLAGFDDRLPSNGSPMDWSASRTRLQPS